jgi:hypothetical protein
MILFDPLEVLVLLARTARFVAPFVPTLLVAAAPAQAAPEPGAPIDQAVPWASYSDDDLRGTPAGDVLASVPESERADGFWHDDMYFDAESGAASLLEKMGVQVPTGVDRDPTPGVAYLNFDGVTLTSECTNSARNCTGLVSAAGGQVTFPPYGSDSTRSAIVNAFKADYQAMDLVVTTGRPPEYLPYVMNVIGGTNSNAGQDPGVCGVAYVACDGAKRNHVSLTFPESCSQIPVVVSHETAHNWGLEHVTDQSDMMYPSVGPNREFRDRCMNITTVDDAPIQCGYVHEHYCPSGGGSEQNSFAELLGVFGTRTPDDIAPEIVSISPADGTDFSSTDSFTITASVNENSNFVGARWTWTEGVPDEIGDSYSRCTNDVCDDDYGAFWEPSETAWDFLKFGPDAPQGTYSFEFEVMDAYGNYDSKSITITVDGGSSSGTSSQGDDGGTGSGDGGTGSGDHGTGSDEGGTSSGDGGTGSGDGGTGSLDDPPDGPGENGENGCGCGTSPTTWGGATLSLLVLCGLRRRHFA